MRRCACQIVSGGVGELRQVPLPVFHFLAPAVDVDGQQPVEVLGGHVDAVEVEFVAGRDDADRCGAAGDLAGA